MNIYPAIFVMAAFIRSSITLHAMLATWSQSIRDKEFLVELRLKNHDPESLLLRSTNGAPVEVGVRPQNNLHLIAQQPLQRREQEVQGPLEL